MEGTKPLDRLIIHGNGPTPRDESSIKKSKGKHLQLSALPDKASSNQFFKTLPQSRRYAFPGRETLSVYGSRTCANEYNETFLKVRGKTIHWDSEGNGSSANLSELTSQNSLSVVDGPSRDVFFEVVYDKVNQPNELNGADTFQGKDDKNSRPIIIDRNSRLRHSYHGRASLSLTGQKLTTPRDCDKNNENNLPTHSLPASALGWEEPFSVPNTSSRSPRRIRNESAETSHSVTPQRADRSALLKQCLRIQKPRQDDESLPSTFENDSNKFFCEPNSTKLTRCRAETNKHHFDSINSYVSFNQNYKVDTTARLGATIRGTRSYGSANGHTATKAKTEIRPNSFTSVKIFPNLNGYADLKPLSITGSSPLGKTMQENDMKSSKAITFTSGKSNVQTYKENVEPADAASNKNVGNSTYKLDSDTSGPSLKCTALQKAIQVRIDV